MKFIALQITQLTADPVDGNAHVAVDYFGKRAEAKERQLTFFANT